MKYFTFSLIVATYNREKELDCFFNSVACQNYNLDLVEILVVDQNKIINLEPIIKKYVAKLHIRHIKSDKIGTAHSRNLGICQASGDIVAFPDDDCLYYDDTLSSVNSVFNEDTRATCLLGKIFDFKEKINIMRKWKKYPFRISWWNFYDNFSEIVLFVKADSKNKFCDLLGPGEYFGSCEGIDYLTGFLCERKVILYDPRIVVWHPLQKISSFSREKVESYGRGFGAFCHKNCNLPIFILFCEAICYHAVFYLIACIQMNHDERKVREECIVSRFNGWVEWNQNSK
jgi:glycosyltransferase involved in cell wall biosynthesis